ncbi:MAG TPA: ATP-binding protein [Candidatus Polarisedimenticolia bacterium]|jgi:signal transduction histidine kinase/CheY-like chemotaxis protein
MTDDPTPIGQAASGARLMPRGKSLSGQLIVFGTLVTLVAVASSIVMLSVLLRRQARAHVVELLAQNQRNARDLQQRSLQELLWISSMMSESPTLRAAMDTYRSESSTSGPRRADLLATVGTEVERIRRLMGKDLVIVTDERGMILASSPALDPGIGAGSSLANRSWMHRVLDPGDPEARPVFGLMDLGGVQFHLGCVPIAMQGFVIGSLTLGDRIDSAWFADLHASLRSDVALVLGGRVLGSTLKGAESWTAPAAATEQGEGAETPPADLISIGGAEYLAVSVPLGPDGQGSPAALLLLRSLSSALEPMQRSLLAALVSCGAITVTLAGVAAWRISRSILIPLERFVSFIRSVATTHDASRRFDYRGLTTEIRILNEAFSDLLASLQAREREILLHQREELMRVERLKESEKLASLGRMLSGAAHEINNPLTAVLGYVDLSLTSTQPGDALRDRLEKARREAQRISALVRNLLKVAHRDTGERTLVDLHQLLKETVALRHHDYTAAGIGIHLEPQDGTIVLHANELELQQVFLNVINNAFDVLKEVQVEPALTIRTVLAHGQATVIMADNGPGMKDPRKVFDHFYTTKDIGKGTGLGLSITHAIVQNHGGTITAHNRLEGGACFTIVLPEGAREEAPTARPRVESPGTRAPLQVTSALIVEDEPSVLEYQMEILRSLGVAPVGARSGDEAIEWLRRREFQVIVSDLRMPGGISGEELYQWVVDNLPSLASRFVFVTGDSASETTRAFLERAGRPYLMKPFAVEDYVQVLRESQPTVSAA